MSLDDTLAAIDAATGCQQCGGPLGDSPSDDFCGENCQAAWRAERVGTFPELRDDWVATRRRFMDLQRLPGPLYQVDAAVWYRQEVDSILATYRSLIGEADRPS